MIYCRGATESEKASTCDTRPEAPSSHMAGRIAYIKDTILTSIPNLVTIFIFSLNYEFREIPHTRTHIEVHLLCENSRVARHSRVPRLFGDENFN